MNGKTYPYLELAALPPVGAALLDPAPAFVFSGDGTRILWANAAGVAFFGETRMGALLDRQLSSLNPLKAQLARLARLLPSETTRLEILRVGLGVSLTTLPAACRRLNLAGGATAVFARAVAGGGAESLATRAERLADTIACEDCLVAVLDRDGKVLGASGGYDALAPAEDAIDALIETAGVAPEGIAKRRFAIGDSERPAGAARFTVADRACFLLIVGPAEEVRPVTVRVPEPKAPAPAPTPEPEAAPPAPMRRHPVAFLAATPETPEELDRELPPAAKDEIESETDMLVEALPVAEASPEVAEETDVVAVEPEAPAADRASEPAPRPQPAPQRRVLFALDADTRFTFVSPELTAIVGAPNADAIGKPWQAVSDALALDPDGRIAAALADAAPWMAAARWPSEDGETIAVDLSAFPVAGDGWQGFGLFHLSDKAPDTRDERITLSDIAVAPVVVAEPEPPAPAEPVDEAAPSEASAHEAPADTALAESDEPLEAPAPTDTAEVVEPEARETPVAGAPSKPRAVPPATGDDLDDVARRSVEEGSPHVHTGDALAAEAEAVPSNVVHLPGTSRPPRHLSGTEQDAFRRIAETLANREAVRETGTPTATGGRESAAPGQDRPAATEIDTRILDRLPIGLVIFRDSRTFFANRTLLELAGYDTLAAFAEAGGAEALFAGGGDSWTDSIAESGGSLKARRRDGTIVPVEARLNAVNWAGAMALMLSIRARQNEPASDTTLMEELKAREQRIDELSAVLDTATDGVIVVDRGGRIASANRAAEALFGIDGAEYLGKPLTALLAEESHRPALDYLDGLASNGVASVLNDGREVIGRVPRGGLIPMFMTMGRIGENTFCAVLRDITHWKNVEEELVAARRAAETANAQKSDFLAKISHEIRTPLNAIIGFSEVMMEERFGPISNDRYRAYLKDIHLSGEHLMSLINDLLDLSKIEAGKLDLTFEAVAVNPMIQECVALMQPQANRERLIIRTSLAADVPEVVADRRSFRQILLNLLSNAVKFTEAGGQVIVSTTLEDNGEVIVRIRDTGVGMSEKDLETAMKPFQQLATAKSGEQRGTGLGLPLTKALVEANRASFAIDSAVDQGTLVKITFPTTRVLAG